jgi:FkbH-like protein
MSGIVSNPSCFRRNWKIYEFLGLSKRCSEKAARGFPRIHRAASCTKPKGVPNARYGNAIAPDAGKDMSNGLDYLELTRAGSKADLRGLPTLRLALLSDAATQLLVPLLRELFRRDGFAAEIYEAPFAAIELEVFNPASGLYQFRPDIVVLLNSTQALRTVFFQAGQSGSDFVLDVETRMASVWDAIRSNTAALVVQSNYVMPYERLFGNYDLKHAGSWYDSVAEINRRIALGARERNNLLVNDIEAVASWFGRRTWFDERFWVLAKSFCAAELLPVVAQNITRISLAARGKNVKCIVLDLDNTLWGGVVGDDGVEGIQLSAHGDGEAFHGFQSFLLALKNRGILLCVCSKNEHAAAIRPFEEHPEMVLRKEDITIFVANWENKTENIKQIRDSLEIGYDSMVFLDDNPFERNAVRTILPNVIVPELPEDPADYVKSLAELNLFETTSVSKEDSSRADLYRAEFERRSVASTFDNFEDYLGSLDMKIDVARFEPSRLARIAQLLQRSNQFNLTTHRYNQGECESMMRNPECVPLYASLRDRFGDHGLISIIVARPRPVESILEITDWLMSCRVLARGVEEYLMNHIAGEAARLNLNFVSGLYIPTSKNAMVKEFFPKFGFEKVGETRDGSTHWLLRVADYRYPKTYIQPEADERTFAPETV